MTETCLPSIDGKPLIKPDSKSTARHKRETISKVAEQVELSTTTLRRGNFVLEHGSEEIKQLCASEQLSIWRAYNFVRRQHNSKLFRLILEAKNHERNSKSNSDPSPTGQTRADDKLERAPGHKP